MRKIRVIHLITKLELGGAQRNTIYTCEKMDPVCFDVFLMSGEGGVLNPSEEFIGGEERRFILIKDLVRAINLFRDVKAFKFLRNEFVRLKPDIVHTHSSKAGIIGRFAAKSAGVPITVHSVHGFAFSRFHPFFMRNLYKVIEKITSIFTNHYIFVSKADIKVAKKLKLLKKASYSLIRSGFDFEKFTKSDISVSEIKKKYQISDQDFICGVIAPFKPQKGLFDLIKIASIVLKKERNIVFFIAGDGELRDSLESEMKKVGIRDRFIMPGFIDDIESVIPVFDIGVSTSLWEGLPQSLIQLRLMNKAAVVTDISGNNEVISDGVNGYTVSVGEFNEFAEKIILLKNDKSILKSLSNRSEELTEWDGKVMVKSQENLYSSLVGNES